MGFYGLGLSFGGFGFFFLGFRASGFCWGLGFRVFGVLGFRVFSRVSGLGFRILQRFFKGSRGVLYGFFVIRILKGLFLKASFIVLHGFYRVSAFWGFGILGLGLLGFRVLGGLGVVRFRLRGLEVVGLGAFGSGALGFSVCRGSGVEGCLGFRSVIAQELKGSSLISRLDLTYLRLGPRKP